MADIVLTPEQEAESAQRLAAIIGEARAQEEALQMARLLVSKPDEQLLGATEFEIRDRVHKLGAHAIETALVERKKGYQGSSMSCPHCQDDARFVDHRPKSFVSLMGDIRFRRAYYHCERNASAGFFPWDVTLHLSPQRLTPGAEGAVTRWRGFKRASARRPSGPCGRWRAFASLRINGGAEPPKPPPANAWVHGVVPGSGLWRKTPLGMEP